MPQPKKVKGVKPIKDVKAYAVFINGNINWTIDIFNRFTIDIHPNKILVNEPSICIPVIISPLSPNKKGQKKVNSKVKSSQNLQKDSRLNKTKK